MPIRATIRPLPEPGHAVLRLTDLDSPPDGLSLSIQRQQGPDTHLADDGWRRTEAWLLPARVERTGDALEFQLGPEICDRLAGVATMRLRVREPDIGVVGSTVVAWPAMLTSGALGASGGIDDTVRLRQAATDTPPPEPEIVPEPEAEPVPLPPPFVATRHQPVIVPPAARKSSNAGTWGLTLLLLLLLSGGGYYYWQNLRPAELRPVATAPAPGATGGPLKPSIRDTVAEYLATKPTPEAMLAKGREFAKSGEMNGAFLVWRRAAEAGNALAQIEVARFYDPLVPQPEAKFTADGTRAADWYERAALAGLPDAQRRLGLLFAQGGAGLNADPAKARLWLEQAAAQNDADAKKALEALKK